MSATILNFPRLPEARVVAFPGDAAPFTREWCAKSLPLIDAALELLAADDAEFERRCRLMADEDGRAMLDSLAGQLERLGGHIADLADALGLTACRIRDGMAALTAS